MAKAKKSETKSESAPKKAPAKKSAKPAAKAPAGMPMVDTDLAAQSAARMLMARKNSSSGNSAAPSPESAMFKQLKAGLNKPHAATMSNVLEKSQGPESSKDHSFFKQTGQNQTYNADVTRSGVPRRNPG
ncbi:MAG TPA: hypothetical protein VHD56_15740 [Tepidisphaeraceae bacterium]|nr:hypothetical protein [Tepidisphaeraceae bacterium]